MSDVVYERSQALYYECTESITLSSHKRNSLSGTAIRINRCPDRDPHTPRHKKNVTFVQSRVEPSQSSLSETKVKTFDFIPSFI